MKKVSAFFFLSICLLSLKFLIKQPTVAWGSVYYRDEESRIYVGNQFIEISFDKTAKGGIYSLKHKLGDIEYRTNKKPPPGLFRIRATRKMIWDNNNAHNFRYSHKTLSNGGVEISIISMSHSHSMQATVIVTVHPGDPMVDFQIHVKNEGKLSLLEVEFPILNGNQGLGDSPSDDILVYPDWGTSRLIEDPIHTWDYPCEFGSDSCHNGFGKRQIYPGWASTQMMAFYDPGGGFYFATYDSQMHTKAFTGGIWEDQNLRLSIRHLLPIHPGKNWSSPYPIKIGTFKGDWYDAADLYKNWARKQWWTEKTVLEKDTPKWFLEGVSFLHFYNYIEWARAKRIKNVIYKLEDIATRTNELSKQFNVPLCALIHAWESKKEYRPNPAKHNLVPPYVPPTEGEEKFRNAMDLIHHNGNYSMIYIGASIYGGVKRRDPVLKYALKTPKGKPFWSWGEKNACMDPTTDFWRNQLIDTSLKVMDLGVDILQMDTWPSAYPHYKSRPQYPMGFGKWIGEAWYGLIGDVRRKCKQKNPNIVISSEEICECYIPILDTYVSRDNAPDFNFQTKIPQEKMDKWRTIPLFSYVYHPYITTFGQIVVSQYGIARAFIRGKLPHMAGNTRNQKAIELFGKVAQACKSYARNYILFGDMLRPQRLSTPKIEIEGSFFANLDVKPEIKFYAPAILHSVWSYDHKIAYFFVNISDLSQNLSIRLDSYHLNRNNYKISEIRDGTFKMLFPSISLPKNINIQISPNQILVLEIS